MTEYSAFPGNLQAVIDELRERGYEIHYGEVEGEMGGPGFYAENGDSVVQITDHIQTWFVTFRDRSRPNVDDCWCRPRRIRSEVELWLEKSESRE